jgi:hypothetical protein
MSEVDAPKPIKANAFGEVDLGFRKFKIKVTLGAMARAEDAFGCDFAELETKLGSTRNIATFIGILAKSAGETITDEDLEAIRYCDMPLQEMMQRIFAAIAGEVEAPGKAEAPSP